MGKIDRSVDIEIGGENRSLKFNIARIEEVEAVTGKSALTMALNPPSDLTVTNLVDLTHIGLKHKDKKLTRETVRGWVEDFMATNPLYTLNILIVGALGFSGLAGEVTVFSKMIDRIKNSSVESEDEGK